MSPLRLLTSRLSTGLLLTTALASLASADRLINMPTATKLTYGSVRVESLWAANDRLVNFRSVMLPVNEVFEFEYRHRERTNETADTIDMYATIISPFTGFTPGIAFGVRDMLSSTDDGRRVWAAVTFREPYEVGETELPADITLGFAVGARTTPMLGVNVPLSQSVHLAAEHDGIRMAIGGFYDPIRNLQFRFIVQDRVTLLGARYSVKF